MNEMIGAVNRLMNASAAQNTRESRGRFYSAAAYHDANQSLANGADTVIQFNSEYHDYGGMHAAPLTGTGTVTKGIGGTTLVGVGTLFTSEFAVGDLILVGTEYNVITAITDDLNLTVALAWAIAAAGAAIARSGNGLVIPAAGVYLIGSNLQFASNSTGARVANFMLNGVTRIGRDVSAAVGDSTLASVCPPRYLSKFDFVQLVAFQSSGGGLNVVYNAENSPVLWAARLS